MIACRFCGTLLPQGALFCGECGRSVSAPPPERTSPRQRLFPVPAQTGAVVVPPVAPVVPEPEPVAVEPVVPEPEPEIPEPEPVVTEEVVVPEAIAPEALGPDPDSTSTVSEPPAPPVPALGPTARVDPLLPVPPAPPIIPVPAVATPEPLEDLERTRLSRAPTGEMWVLQFSTGESVLVTGTGLVGRNPAAEPGEYVDHLVTLFDAGRSVSKTHAEFGQEGGRFWVSDRYSTNGTVIRPPGEEPRRCAPGRRYLVSRGTRVDIGEQFFVVS
jgi:hypothetical protein